ncbi:V-type ATP synthase subunit F [Candidatus Woesearchaeota archaeon]|nr:V-type ATP synthase subunit F [Candidatus Woesearchaeota archaeon]
MAEIAVVGTSSFIVGFQLAGVRKIFEVHNNAQEALHHAQNDKDTSLIITDEETMQQLDEHTREMLEASVNPVCIVLSEKGEEQDTLRKLIIRSVGVDLLGDDHGKEN